MSNDELLKGMMIDGVAATEDIDSQGEKLSIEGADISALEAGMGRLNDNHGKLFAHSLGRIIGAKKIFTKTDCDNARQKMYWNKLKRPYIYVSGELYDDTDHPNAKATAAIFKNLNKNNCPLSIKMSVEGKVEHREEGGILDRTKIHSVALTFTPANKNTLALPLIDGLSKSEEPDYEDLLKSITVMPNAPTFIERHEDCVIVDLVKSVVNLLNDITEIKKALSAGYASSGSGAVGGAALQVPAFTQIHPGTKSNKKDKSKDRPPISGGHSEKKPEKKSRSAFD
jgi:hypothetical protein